MIVFEGLLRYAQTGHGDVKTLQGEFQGRLRLRVGDYRILFSPIADSLHIHASTTAKTPTAEALYRRWQQSSNSMATAEQQEGNKTGCFRHTAFD